jgi:hypothetical protein
MQRKSKRAWQLAAMLGLSLTAGAASAQQPVRQLPNPILYLTGIEPYTTPGGSFIRYRYDVLNKASYPAAMFAAAPNLPPCGLNANAARTWVDFYVGGTSQRIYGFCALGTPQDLGQIWFSVPEGTIPPSYVSIELIDRQANIRYRSNLADTVM